MPVKIDIDMPENCQECIFHYRAPGNFSKLHLCWVTNRILKRMAHYRVVRPSMCPLKECK